MLIVKGSLTVAFQRKLLVCSLALWAPGLVVAGGYKIHLNFGQPDNLHRLITHIVDVPVKHSQRSCKNASCAYACTKKGLEIRDVSSLVHQVKP